MATLFSPKKSAIYYIKRTINYLSLRQINAENILEKDLLKHTPLLNIRWGKLSYQKRWAKLFSLDVSCIVKLYKKKKLYLNYHSSCLISPLQILQITYLRILKILQMTLRHHPYTWFFGPPGSTKNSLL